VFFGLDLSGARFQGAQLEGADLRGCKLTGADLRGCNLKNAKLANADLRDANLGPLLISNERLLPARLERADARYTDFRGADLRQTVLAEADLAYADLTGAKLRATDFRGAILQGIKLSLDAAVEAIFDETRYDAPQSVDFHSLGAALRTAPEIDVRRQFGCARPDELTQPVERDFSHPETQPKPETDGPCRHRLQPRPGYWRQQRVRRAGSASVAQDFAAARMNHDRREVAHRAIDGRGIGVGGVRTFK